MKRTLATLMLTGIAAFSLSCGARAHLTEGHGERSRAYFESQRASADARTESPTELDSEEATIIHNQYRKDLGAAPQPRGTSDRVLVVEPEK